MRKGIVRRKVEGVSQTSEVKLVAGRDRAFWQRLFSKENSPAAKTVEAPAPSVAKLREGDMKAILRCIEDGAVWRKVGSMAIDRKLITSLCPEDARDVFVCLAKNQPGSDKFLYFSPGQIKPELFSEQQALDVANASLEDGIEFRDKFRYGWLLGKESFARMQLSARRAVLFRLMEGPWLMGFEGVAGAEWEGFGRLSEHERRHACWSVGHEGWDFFTRERLLLFEKEDRLEILASAIRHKKKGALERARSLYCDEDGRASLFQEIVNARIYSEGEEGNEKINAITLMAGMFGGMLGLPAAALATLSAALNMSWGQLLNEGGEAVLFVGMLFGAIPGWLASFGIEGVLTRFKVKRSERKAMREAVKNAEEMGSLSKGSGENVA